MSKTIKERIIDRLRGGFGINIPYDADWITHESRSSLNPNSFSWYFVEHGNIGSSVSATECLKWKRWVILDGEICEYDEKVLERYKSWSYIIEDIDEEKVRGNIRYLELKKLYNKYGYRPDRLIFHNPLESYLSEEAFHPLFNFITMFNIVVSDDEYNGRIVARINANPYYEAGMMEEDYVRGKYHTQAFSIDLKDYAGVETWGFCVSICECVDKVIEDFETICKNYGKDFGLNEEYFETMRDYLKKFLTDTFTSEVKLALILRNKMVEGGFLNR